MKVTYFVKTDGACDYYRVVLPLTKASSYKMMKALKVLKGEMLAASISEDTRKLEEIFSSDIFVAPRVADESFLGTMDVLKKDGKKVVVEYDDNIFKVSPYSPHYEENGTEEVKVKLPTGEILPLWEDGKNINIKENRKRVEALKIAVEKADMVTVTTDILAEVYRPYNKNVKVLPNCVDMDIWKKLPLQRNGTVNLTWFGGHSHYEDWLILAPVLPKIMEKYKNVNLILMGAKFDATLKDLPKDRIEYHPWVPTPAYPYKAAILDPTIALIPLQDSEFNRCKSSIKWVEMSALKVPSVVSQVSPYKEVYNGKNAAFVENNEPQAWIDAISHMIENPQDRESIGNEAYKTVEEDFDIDKKCVLWANAYKELLN